MNSVFILLNSLNDWKPYCETDSLMTVTDYLEHRYGERTPKLVINLSDEYGYNSEGYYCSLLAQARGHRVLPGVETLNKLESGAGIRMNRNLQQLCQQWIERNRITDETWQLNIYFGTCREKGLEKIARFIFDHYPCPILRVTMNNHARNQIESVQALSLRQLSESGQDDFANALDRRNLGTLGGGNHFIEVDRAEDGRLFLVVHSGSRHLGTEVANFYQDEGRRALWGGAHYQIKATIDQMKAEGRFKEIQKTITALKREHDLSIPKDLAYVEGALFDDYIHDMKLTQKFAVLNRKEMVDVILSDMGLTPVDEFTTIHNYIDTDAMILRKGAVSAKAGEKLLIPINMRDGSLICSGKGNEDWNCSAPHGAGRLMSRKAAFNALSMEEFQKEMEGIYTTCVVPDTLDESPMAYKSMEEIVAQIGPTAEIIERIRPVYNFKAAD